MPSEKKPTAEWKEYPEPKFPSDKARDAYRRAQAQIRRAANEPWPPSYLDLSGAGLTALPPEIGQLTELTWLRLYNNNLTTLPPEIGELEALTQLYLNENQLTALPAQIGRLKALTELDLHNNHLKTLPPQIGKLTALVELDLHNNQLKTLPPEIGQIPTLTRLNLTGNQLTMLPSEIGEIPALKHLFLGGNEGLLIPDEVLEKSPKAILNSYFSRQEHGERPLNEVKVLLLGRGEAGKTSLSRALRGEKFRSDEAETPGIDIRPWRMQCGKVKITAHLWDFAGQEITHETHRSFLTRRSLYLVVLDGRGGQQMDEAEYWLDHVKKYGGDESPVLVVLNKWKKHGPYEVEQRRLQREFPFIRGFVQTDCADGTGIAELVAAMADIAGDMPGVRAKWAMSYFRVATALRELAEKEGRAWLSWADYRKVCAAQGVEDEEKQEWLAENLHALGVALYYGDNPNLRDKRVLNPTWAANGLYAIIQGVRQKPRAGHAGEFEARTLPAVLRAGFEVMGAERGSVDAYLEDGVPEFLMALLLDREIGFLAEGAGGAEVYLVPGQLPMDEPEVRDYDVRAHMDEATARFRYCYTFLPAGVMSRFIVRTHALGGGLFRWQQGTVLGWGDARALVLADRRRNPRVEVYLKGGSEAERLALAGVIRANMEVIHRDLPEGLRGKEELDLSLPGEQWKEVAELREFESEEKMLQVRTRGGIVEVLPRQELNRLEPESARRGDAPRLKVFVSYSHEDYKDCNQMKLRLARLANEGLVSYWHDGQIRAGQEWDRVIRRELEEADVVVLLMSEGFFASSYIEGVEVQTARARQQRGEADILPVLLEDCDGFKKHAWLGQLQTVPSVVGRLRPVRRFTPKETAWDSVENELRRMIADLARTKRRRR